MGGTYTRRSTIFSQNGKNWIYSQTIGNLTTFQIPIDILKKLRVNTTSRYFYKYFTCFDEKIHVYIYDLDIIIRRNRR